MLPEAEGALFAAHPVLGAPPAIFILGAPRSGSTILYQVLAAAFGLPVISNFANAFTPAHPAIGILASHAVRLSGMHAEAFANRFGKTDGLHAPSEGSAVFATWCGGGHPSEIVSPGILPGREVHMHATFAAVAGATGRPLLTKNAWNCFRLPALAAAFPGAAFIWIRRDVGAGAASDLAARYAVQGNPNTWNSATPRNIDALRTLPYAEQVLENQFEFARAISEASAGLARGRFAEFWYEDLVADPEACLSQLGDALPLLKGLARQAVPTGAVTPPPPARLPESDQAAIVDAIGLNPARWAPLQHRRRA